MIKLQKVLNQEMSRRQFLSLIGLGVLTIIGLPALMGVLTSKHPDLKVGSGYGAADYGK